MSNPAEIYENYVVPAVHARFVPSLLAAAHPQPGERVLDVGCGTGIVARSVAAHAGPNGKVVGLDPSSDMLEVARRVAEQENLDIEWLESPAESMPFPSGGFDLILCQQVLQFIPDRLAALREMHRVLTDDGQVVLHVMLGIEHHPFDLQLSQSIERHLGTAVAGDIYSLGDEAELRALLEEAGFKDIEIEIVEIEMRFPDPERYVASRIDAASSAVPRMQTLTDGERAALSAAVELDMQDAVTTRTRDRYLIDHGYSHLVRASC